MRALLGSRSHRAVTLLAVFAGACAGGSIQPRVPQPAEPSSEIALIQLESEASCRQALTAQVQLCGTVSFHDGDNLEVAHFDVNADSQADLIVRTFSSLTCGTRGCSTNVYLAEGGGFRLSDVRIVSIGAITSCRRAGEPGLRFSSGRGPGQCFIFR